MSRGLRASLLALYVGIGLTACTSGGGEKASGTGTSGQSSANENVTIESSLQGLETLPPRIRWSVTTSLPPEEVRGVRFIVNSDRWWGDDEPPYTYGPEGAYLATGWIASLAEQDRAHSFEVRVFATSGASWSETVRARLPAPELARDSPGAFKGYRGSYGYGRLSAAHLANPPPPGKWPDYHAYLDFIGASLFVSSDEGKFAWEMSSDRKRVYLSTPIFKGSHAEPGKVHGYRELDDVLCSPDGPPAVYAWSHMKGRVLSRYRGENYYAQYLRLNAVEDPCAERRRMLEGVWDEITD